MAVRIKINDIFPNAFKALANVDQVVKSSSLSALHQELIKIRASQINGCAYCVNMHTMEAKKLGETDKRLHLIAVWKEAGSIFSNEEQLLFKITEQVTLISQQGLSDELYDQAIEQFGEANTAGIIMGIIAINSWNIIAISTKMEIE